MQWLAAKPKFPLMCPQSGLSLRRRPWLLAACVAFMRITCHFAKLLDTPPLLQSVVTQNAQISSEGTSNVGYGVPSLSRTEGNEQTLANICNNLVQYPHIVLAGYIRIYTTSFTNKQPVRTAHTVHLCNPYYSHNKQLQFLHYIN